MPDSEEEDDGTVENIFKSTQGLCLSHPAFLGSCPVDWCRHHLDCIDYGAHSVIVDRGIHDTCSLRIAYQMPHTLEEVATMLGVTRERIRQIEVRAIQRAGRSMIRLGLIEDDDISKRKRRYP